MPGTKWIDISMPLKDGMVHWPGDTAVRISRIKDVETGDSHTLSSLVIGSHTGTHIDAPAHFIKSGSTVDRASFDALVGRARVIEIKDKESVKPSELEVHKIRKGERLLFKTVNASLWESENFSETFVFVSREGAEYLAAKGVRLVGVDYLSVGGYKGGGGAQHKALLNAGVCIVEGLNLSRVAPGRYDFICLPLRLENGDGAPARAIIRRI